MFGSLGFTELILILVIVLIIFGAGKLPQIGEGVGKAIKGFKKSVHEAEVMDAEFQAGAQGEANTTTVSPQISQQDQPLTTSPSPPATIVEPASVETASSSKA